MIIRGILKQHNWDIPVIIDSPLAVKQFKIYGAECPEL
jgi:hypothetical protein